MGAIKLILFLLLWQNSFAQPGSPPQVRFNLKSNGFDEANIHKYDISVWFFNDSAHFAEILDYDYGDESPFIWNEEYFLNIVYDEYRSGQFPAEGDIVRISFLHVEDSINMQIFIKLAYRMSWNGVIELSNIPKIMSGLFFYDMNLYSEAEFLPDSSFQYLNINTKSSGTQILDLYNINNHRISSDNLMKEIKK